MVSFRRTHCGTGSSHGKSSGLMYVVLHFLVDLIPAELHNREKVPVLTTLYTKQAKIRRSHCRDRTGTCGPMEPVVCRTFRRRSDFTQIQVFYFGNRAVPRLLLYCPRAVHLRFDFRNGQGLLGRRYLGRGGHADQHRHGCKAFIYRAPSCRVSPCASTR